MFWRDRRVQDNSNSQGMLRWKFWLSYIDMIYVFEDLYVQVLKSNKSKKKVQTQRKRKGRKIYRNIVEDFCESFNV